MSGVIIEHIEAAIEQLRDVPRTDERARLRVEWASEHLQAALLSAAAECPVTVEQWRTTRPR